MAYSGYLSSPLVHFRPKHNCVTNQCNPVAYTIKDPHHTCWLSGVQVSIHIFRRGQDLDKNLPLKISSSLPPTPHQRHSVTVQPGTIVPSASQHHPPLQLPLLFPPLHPALIANMIHSLLKTTGSNITQDCWLCIPLQGWGYSAIGYVITDLNQSTFTSNSTCLFNTQIELVGRATCINPTNSTNDLTDPIPRGLQ